MRAYPKVFTVLVVLLTLSAIGFAATASLNIHWPTSLTDKQYQKKTFDRVVKVWKTPPSAVFPQTGKKAVVQAVIGRDGKLVSATLTLQSGSKKWDEIALNLVHDAAPYDPLPAGYAPATVEVHFHVSAQ